MTPSRRLPCPAVLGLVAILSLGAAIPARAIAPRASSRLAPGDEALLSEPPRPPQDAAHPEWSAARAASSAEWASFTLHAGGSWSVRWDRLTDRPALAWGSGIPWPATRGDDAATLAALAERARALLDAHPGLLRVPARAALALDASRSGAVDSGRIWRLAFQPTVDGVAVRGAVVVFHVHSGNLVSLGARGIGDGLLAAPIVPAVTPEGALEVAVGRLARAFAASGPSLVVSELLDAGSLALVPERTGSAVPGDGVAYRLAWRVAFRLRGDVETWTADVDAMTGEVVALFDANRYACPPPASGRGRVVGGVYPGPIEEVAEEMRAMPHALVTQPADVTADEEGVLAAGAGVLSETTLSGRYFSVTCAACSNPAQANASLTGWGNLSLGLGGVNALGNGRSTKAERNCFHALNAVRLLATKHLTDAEASGWFSRTTPATVNLDFFTCNAFFDGSGVNFLVAGGGCNNTGEIADVMQHEWGHGLDQFTGGGFESARGEAIGDIVAFMSTHDSRLGPYFVVGDARGLREADEVVAGVVRTASNVGAACFGDPHCEGEAMSQAFWHLARNLRAKYGDAAGWRVLERLFFASLPLSDTMLPNDTRSQYDAVMLVDDDDGDLANGTPNATEINEAFGHHELASTPLVGDAPECAAPPAPAVTLTPVRDAATGLWEVQVSWTASPGAASYEIERNDLAGRGADLLAGVVAAPGTSFTDVGVLDGVTYRYRVWAVDAAGCRSTGDNQQQVTPDAVASLELTWWVVNDFPGNYNGIAEPGETIWLPIEVRNTGSQPVPLVTATLSTTHPGITITTNGILLGDVNVDELVASSDPQLTVVLDPSVPCPDSVDFTLELESPAGCSAAALTMTVGRPTGCEPPAPRPRLRVAQVVVGDSAAWGGSGDGDAASEPTERVRLPVDLVDAGNGPATRVTGFLSLLSGPPGVVVSDGTASWPDIDTGLTERTNGGAPPHFQVTLPGTVPCAGTILLNLVVSYDGGATRYSEGHEIVLPVGRMLETTLLQDDFEGPDAGWTHATACTGPPCNPEDDWQRGPPGATNFSDPRIAHSGSNVWGNDLGSVGGMPSDGNYSTAVDSYLESPSVDCTGRTGVHVSFWRFIGVEDRRFDEASVVVGGFDVWRNPTGQGALFDGEWVFQEIDISAIADGQSDVRVRFELKSNDFRQFGGWAIDDVRVFARELDCAQAPACIAPPVPGPVGPYLRSTGGKGDDHAEWTWAGAPLDPLEQYRLYRGTAADALDLRVTPLGFTGTAFDDTLATEGRYFYTVVRASCLGVEGPDTP
jgi:hypothetical protein